MKLELNNINKTYLDKNLNSINILNNISLSIDNIGVSLFIIKGEKFRHHFLKLLASSETGFTGDIRYEPNNGITKRILVEEYFFAFPWLTVKQNICLPNLDMNNLESKAADFINFVGLKGYNDYEPKDVQSGFSLRIALARALFISPDLIILNNVFSKLELETRKNIYDLLFRIYDIYQTSIIVVNENLLSIDKDFKNIYFFNDNTFNEKLENGSDFESFFNKINGIPFIQL